MTTKDTALADANLLNDTGISVSVCLTALDLQMVRTFAYWAKLHGSLAPQRHEIEKRAGAGQARGRVFRRLVMLGVVAHSRNGTCWLTLVGQGVLNKLQAAAPQ